MGLVTVYLLPYRRKTFDEIREENRRRHGQQSYPSTSPQSPQAKSGGWANKLPQDVVVMCVCVCDIAGGGERKKRNKYGDVIED